MVLIEVELIDVISGLTFRRIHIDSSIFPSDIKTGPTRKFLHIGKEIWEIVEATPDTLTKSIESKSLTLKVRKIERSF